MSKKEKQKNCPICNEKLSFLKLTLKDGVKVCAKHVVDEAGLSPTTNIEQFTVEDIRERVNQNKRAQDEKQNEIQSFLYSKQIGNFVAFDEKEKQWAVLSPTLGKIQTVYNYDEIVDFELLEDGNSVASGGLGRALVGGALFGGTGAIVGGVTGKKKSKEFCSSLRLKITINDISKPVVYINFIEKKTKKDGSTYKKIAEEAQECLSVFQLICDNRDKNGSQTTKDAADEIMKYKNLLDAGAITEEEFQLKKKELLES